MYLKIKDKSWDLIGVTAGTQLENIEPLFVRM